ncbi:pyridoxine 5'-phosphate synthase [Desulfogranum japonicum]|uniref:pyridoxine 5'-phosphate synthase n=1 Tax=Desulfogranum japonicum TaxID=231447 RepID=UPI0003FEF33C|nr:pyridoxine 5'-phosphate synthase [Desulfogranum japonicum]
MPVNFSISEEVKGYTVNSEELIRFTVSLQKILGVERQVVSIVLMTNGEMAFYNLTYRKKEGPTNVLSFPADHDIAVPDIQTDLGDILIALETTEHEARQQNTTLHHRIRELIIHGMLHLIGYDHERSEQEALEMWDREKELFQQLIHSRRTHMPHLAINVDHVATVRQARGTTEPDPVTAAAICELAGAEGIVVHLREDRRHIQDRDVRLLRQTVKTRLNLEMAIAKEIVDIALEIGPDMVTLVPEKRQELTTEGGLDVVGNFKKISKTIAKMTKASIPVSLFIDPEADQIEAALEAGATYVELHTGRYCDAITEKERDEEFRLIAQAAELAYESGLRVNAGHGLDYRNTAAIAALPTIEELSIGHAVISRAVLVGLDQAVREILSIVKQIS